jgi:hypothetical protein
MAITQSRRPIAAARIRRLVGQLLDASTLCAIATVTPRNRSHVNTAYFAWTPEFRLVWLSDPQATHSRNVRANGSAAIAVYDSRQSWGKPDRGIQLTGSARELTATGRGARNAERAYEERFPECRETDLSALRFYELRPRRLKIFDEPAMGPATFVTARVASSGNVTWERTEIYDVTS